MVRRVVSGLFLYSFIIFGASVTQSLEYSTLFLSYPFSNKHMTSLSLSHVLVNILVLVCKRFSLSCAGDFLVLVLYANWEER